MAEGLLEGLLGGEEERAEAEAGEGRISAEAFAAALAEEQARHDPEVARAAAEFLRNQSALLKAQAEELEEQRTLRLRHLESQSREGAIRRAGQRLRVGMQVFTALVATVIGGVLLVMLGDAFRSQAVIVDAFDAPPALAGRGLTGKVVATASAKAPHYADPLKAWGDLKAREGRWNEALLKYDAALKYAPAWRDLRQARDVAAQHRS